MYKEAGLIGMRWLLVSVGMQKKSQILLPYLSFLPYLPYLYMQDIKAPVIIYMEHKRKYRELSDETKKSISRSNKGRPKSFTHRKNISIALQNYWQSVPSRDEHLSMQEYLAGENNEVKSSNSDGE